MYLPIECFPQNRLCSQRQHQPLLRVTDAYENGRFVHSWDVKLPAIKVKASVLDGTVRLNCSQLSGEVYQQLGLTWATRDAAKQYHARRQVLEPSFTPDVAAFKVR